jgi:hypothetical protein
VQKGTVFSHQRWEFGTGNPSEPIFKELNSRQTSVVSRIFQQPHTVLKLPISADAEVNLLLEENRIKREEPPDVERVGLVGADVCDIERGKTRGIRDKSIKGVFVCDRRGPTVVFLERNHLDEGLKIALESFACNYLSTSHKRVRHSGLLEFIFIQNIASQSFPIPILYLQQLILGGQGSRLDLFVIKDLIAFDKITDILKDPQLYPVRLIRRLFLQNGIHY